MTDRIELNLSETADRDLPAVLICNSKTKRKYGTSILREFPGAYLVEDDNVPCNTVHIVKEVEVKRALLESLTTQTTKESDSL